MLAARRVYKLQALAQEVNAMGSGAETLVVQADLSRLEDIQSMIGQTLEKFGRIDVLVNNAGITKDNLIFAYYEDKEAAKPAHRPVEEWLSNADQEISLGITETQFLEEADRRLSCGLCFGCERCWMYCTPSCFTKVATPGPGNYYNVRLDTCDGCSKCVESCPCGFLEMI